MVNGREPALSGGEVSTANSAYDSANRLTSVDGVAYTFDANGNASINSAHRLLNDGQNTYSYDSANRLTSIVNPQSSIVNRYNGLGDSLSQDGVNYTLDLNAGLTQVLSEGQLLILTGLEESHKRIPIQNIS